MTDSDEPTLFDEELMQRSLVDESYLTSGEGYRVFGGHHAETFRRGKITSSLEPSYLADNTGMEELSTPEDRRAVNDAVRGLIKKPSSERLDYTGRDRVVELEDFRAEEETDITDSF